MTELAPLAEPTYAVPRTVSRVLDLLEIVLAEPCNLTKAADSAGLTPTTTLRHLRALESRGYITRNSDNRYAAGPTMCRLAATLHGAGELDGVIEAVQPHLDALATSTGESAYLAVGDGRDASYIASAQSDRAIRHVAWIGQTVPLSTTAVGAAMREPGTAVARSGAVDPDISAVSIGLPPLGNLALAISVIGPTHRFEQHAPSHMADLERVAAAVTAHLGLGSSM